MNKHAPGSGGREGRGPECPRESTLDAVYVHLVPCSEFPVVPSYSHYPQGEENHRARRGAD